ncbi:FAD-binding and (Fe-S)-binding domain-containing protein [Actinopolyspora saharensis]|uniref:FAD-binding and (Fe-S)-binding domain-containing protein n=1 Tax=Actinopolyspora saharensis TaxID=995062 RepID=UPI003F66A44A
MADGSATVPAHPDARFSAGMFGTDAVNVKGLEAQLRRHVLGEVRFDSGTRAMYASDASNYRQVPLGVVLPATVEDVVATTMACHRYGAPLLSRGGGTSLSGETVNVAVVVDFSKYLTSAGEVDVARRTVTAQPGVINEELNRSAGERGLVFGPDPSSHSRCTIGGNIGNNSCGIHSVQSHFHGPGPRTSDNVRELEVLTYDGERFRVGTDEERDLDEIVAAGGRKGEIYAALRCVGVSTCRTPSAEHTMCPSYQVTREEKHTTRGRARLLFEMLRGEVITDGWQSGEVSEALDLCLACKGCTSDCPVGVDMPAYKAEFRHHHYRSLRRWRPRNAYALGFIDQVARFAALMPGAVNTVTRTPVLRSAAKWLGGIDQRRELPGFAPVTLRRWFADRGGTANPHGRRVLLFPDTFNDHLHTDVGVACVEALESAGWQVVVPERHVCCGRPMYDYGFLDVARSYLRNVLTALRADIRAGTPVVGMEPSCLAVFRDELGKMLPHDEDGGRLAANSYHFAEFCQRFELPVPSTSGRALLWGHCHHRATGGLTPDQRMLERMGFEVDPVSGGCCGVAGSWGYERGKFGLSVDCGEQALLPAVRAADEDALVVADGFSCRGQIEQVGGRRAVHSGQVLRLAQEASAGEPPACGPPARPPAGAGTRALRATALLAGVGALGACASGAWRRAA